MSMIVLRINLPNFVQFKQYQCKSRPRRITRYFVQDVSVSTTVNINSLNTNTVNKWWKTKQNLWWVYAVFYL